MFPRFDKLSDSDFAENLRLMTEAGMPDPAEFIHALVRLREAAESVPTSADESSRSGTPLWFRTLRRILLEAPSPQAVVATVDQFVANSRSPGDAFRLFEESPRSLEVLARLSCGSSYLTQALLNQPEALQELTSQRRTAEMKSREEFHEEARQFLESGRSTDEKLQRLRRFQKQELLRIGMCDAFGLLDLKFVTLQISLMADAMVQICLELACQQCGLAEAPFSVVALGKHGGEELNYSSDIDLLLIATTDQPATQKVARLMIDGISRNMPSGFLYRVDMRLRPWGDAGPLVSTPDAFEAYLNSHAELWEKQALLKARVIAGCPSAGRELLNRLPPLLFSVSESEVLSNVRRMKAMIEDRLRRRGKLASEVKLGQGSIRDVEFLVQALQLIHGGQEPRLASANTLDALVRLCDFGIINAIEYRQLREGYVFLRTLEHALQLMHNQQTHELPTGSEEREWLARRLDYPGESVLLSRFHEHRRSVRQIFDRWFAQAGSAAESAPTEAVAEDAHTSDHTISSRLTDTIEQSGIYAELGDPIVEGEDASRCRVIVRQAAAASGGDLLVAVTGPETAGLLSMICAQFFSYRLDIREGHAVVGPASGQLGRSVPAGRFLGLFLLQETSPVAVPAAAGSPPEVPLPNPILLQEAIEQHLNSDMALLAEGKRDLVRQSMIELFCQRIRELPANLAPQADLELQISSPDNSGLTEVVISGDDSFGFFFELANALSICGFRIRRAELGTIDGRVSDRLWVSESDGSAVTRDHRREELRTAVTLIKQFTHWLPSNSDPHHSLLRFRDLLHSLLEKSERRTKVASLKQPKFLRAISRVLGMSRYLWEDFLQSRSDNLLSLLTDSGQLERRVSRDELRSELQQAGLRLCTEHGFDLPPEKKPLRSAGSVAGAADDIGQSINSFKDRHLFRIDLRHVLGHCGAFGSFSEEVTELAEVTVEAAVSVAWKELAAAHGLPRREDGSLDRFTLAGLGKFGGVEMGFASDIELFLIYESDCRTDGGRSSVSASTFFERLINRVAQLVESRHRGIFEIDLRMRPYGQAGPAAVSLKTLRQYYSTDGDAWPYERQSLVKLRCVAGDHEFGRLVQETCYQMLFSSESFDFAAMRAMRERQIRQLVRGGTVNAKLSDGGLVDCEYAVQALQLTFGRQEPALQTSNTIQALTAAQQSGKISLVEFEQIRQAYIFLRQLIDCLRMVRGNAEDLTLPASATTDYQQLARRLKAVHESSRPLDELENQMAVVRWFSNRVEEICSAR